MDRSGQKHPSHLFTIRLWLEELGEAGCEWRGKAQHVKSGQVRYFAQLGTLAGLLAEMLDQLPGTDLEAGATQAHGDKGGEI